MTLPKDESLPRAVYVYKALTELGVGETFALVILKVPNIVEKRDLGMYIGIS
jgi:hypothetical protein